MKRAILATGGIDSTVLMYRSAFTEMHLVPTILTVDYGHDAMSSQLALLKKHCEDMEYEPPVVLKVHYAEEAEGQGLFTANPQVDHSSDDPDSGELYKSDEMMYGSYYIEGRNMIMLAHAMAYCAKHQIDELWVGYQYDKEDWENYRCHKLITADNSPHFLDMMNVLALTGFSRQVRLRAPFYEDRSTKAEIILEGWGYGINIEKDTHSCYWNKPCGKCYGCKVREAALKEAAIRTLSG